MLGLSFCKFTFAISLHKNTYIIITQQCKFFKEFFYDIIIKGKIHQVFSNSDENLANFEHFNYNVHTGLEKQRLIKALPVTHHINLER